VAPLQNLQDFAIIKFENEIQRFRTLLRSSEWLAVKRCLSTVSFGLLEAGSSV
jgi:hypothetical protein